MSMKYQGLALAGVAAAMLMSPTAMAAEDARYIVKYQHGKGQAVRAQVQSAKGKVKLDLPGRAAMAVCPCLDLLGRIAARTDGRDGSERDFAQDLRVIVAKWTNGVGHRR